MLLSQDTFKHTYVGYTKNLSQRLKLHNSGKGAKYTKGRSWKIIYSKKFPCKSDAIKNEYKLKNNYLLRKSIKNKAL
tara:strand:- start:352 stop:582 length:231 start_codon:yes stop_codon:yes gene_type:complete